MQNLYIFMVYSSNMAAMHRLYNLCDSHLAKKNITQLLSGELYRDICLR